MKLVHYILLISFNVIFSLLPAQQLASLQERTPEQEAAFQTEKLQQELQLTSEQARQVHEINLKYARARQQSNTRADAIQRIRDKEADLNRILNENQRTTLQNKRYERTQFQQNGQRTGASSSPDNQQRIQRTEPIRQQQNPQQNAQELRRTTPNVPGNRQTINTQPRTSSPRVAMPQERTLPESNRRSANESSGTQNRNSSSTNSSGGRR